MNPELHMIAALAGNAVYDINIDIGSTEYAVTKAKYQDEKIQVLAFAGTNESLDWFWNLMPLWWDGVKLGTYLSVKRVAKRFIPDSEKKLMVEGHSKGGPPAMYWKQKYGADWCVAFCPAPGFRKKIKLENTTIFIDPDDLVPKAGRILFCHPNVDEVVTLPQDKKWWQILKRINDHLMDHIIKFLKERKPA